MTRQASSGFTLIEMLVTLAIMSLVMMALQVSLQSTLLTHDDVALEIASVREGPKILDVIERDLRSLHSYNIKDKKVLRGETQRHAGLRGDRIDFLSNVDSVTRVKDPESSNSEPKMVASDVNEVGYRLRAHPQSSDFMQLYRREDLFVDEEPLEGGRYELLHDRITRFEVSYQDQLGEDGEVEEEWNMEERKKLPAAIIVDLELQAQPELIGDFVESELLAQRLYRYRRVIPLSRSHNETLRLRPVLPLSPAEVSQQSGGNGDDDTPIGAGVGGDGQGQEGRGMQGVTEGGRTTGGGIGIGGVGGRNGAGGETTLTFDGDALDSDISGQDFLDQTGEALTPEEQETLDDFLEAFRNSNGQGDGIFGFGR